MDKEFKDLLTELKLNDLTKDLNNITEEDYNQLISFIFLKTKNNPILEKYKSLLSIIYNNRGQLKYLAVDFEGAVEDYNLALEFYPKGVTYYNRGTIKYRMGDFKSAEIDFERAINLDPNVDEYHLALSRCREQINVN